MATGNASSTDLATDQGSLVDSQVSDDADDLDRHKTWTDALFASFRASDQHVSDDEIFEILKAGGDGEAAAELFAAKSVTVPMYCVWKTKYRHLNLEELRAARRRELWRARGLIGVLFAVALLGAGGIVFALGRAAQASITSTAHPVTPVSALPQTKSTPVEHQEVGDTRPGSAPALAPKASPVNHQSTSGDVPPSAESGYRIQVAAAPSLQEGRELMERLASSGYPAYLSRAIVSDIEVFRVRVGPFDTLAAAEEVASQLRRNGYSAAWIAR